MPNVNRRERLTPRARGLLRFIQEWAMQDRKEYFTQRSRRALSLAQEEAERLQHSYIGTEHLLLGLMREKSSIAHRVLIDLGLDQLRVEKLVVQLSQAVQRDPDTRLDLTQDAKKVLELAVDETRRMGHHYIGTEHLLLGLVQQNRSIAADILRQLNVAPEDVRRQTRRVMQEVPAPDETPAAQVVDSPLESQEMERSTSQQQSSLSEGTGMDEKDIYRAILDAQEKSQPAAVATIIRGQGSLPRHVGSKMLVFPDGHIVGTVGGGAMESKVIAEAQAASSSGEARVVSYTLNNPAEGDPGVCGGTVEIFIEPLVVPPTLLVVGCGHVGKALAELAKWTGFRVIVSDDRAEFCNPEHIPNMDGYLVCPPPELPQHLTAGPQSQIYVASVSRGVAIDADLLPALLALNLPYLGVIGSKRRWTLTLKTLQERGFTPEQLSRIHTPIGLELQAETPQEIAISIMAEIIMIRRGGTGQPMQYAPQASTSE